MEEITQLWVFCGFILAKGKVGHLINKIDIERVVNFVDRLGETSVYIKFVHLLNALMESVSNVLMDDLSGEVVAYAHDNW